MCGIIGYLGKQRALPILIDGLKNLEYRGYDSAGLAVVADGKIDLERAVGKIINLENKLAKSKAVFAGSCGIAHTRWATHGGVTEKNAHPHFDCGGNIYLVHNGIIENYKELKDGLERRGHKFSSETDTEALVHLVEEIKTKNGNFRLEEAVRQALRQVRGTYGIAVLDAREPNKLVIARNFSPLVLGVGRKEFVAASDTNAIFKFTNKILFLKNGEIACIEPKGYRIFTIDNKPVERTTETLEYDDADRGLGNFPHFMLKEIHECGDALRNSMRGRLDPDKGIAILGGLRDVEKRLANAKRIIVCACGSAYYAAKAGEYMLEECAGIPVDVELASEIRYKKPIWMDGDVFFAVSQSGETADTIASLYEAKENGVLALGLVNAVGSTISRETDAGVYQHVGPEIGVAATKSFISQAGIFALLSLFLGRKRGMPLLAGQVFVKELQKLPKLAEKILERKSDILKLAKKYRRQNNFFYLGRKYNFPLAQEGALKLKEIAYVHAEGYAAGEMKHGPIALIDKNFPTMAIIPMDSVYDKMISNLHEIKARGGKILAIATAGDHKIGKIADDVFYVPKTAEVLSPILNAIPLQLFAYYSGILRGRDVDKPRNLAKSVTVE